jgi:predicted dithiol-disulfide oxidoreductase (DUF899 family)
VSHGNSAAVEVREAVGEQEPRPIPERERAVSECAQRGDYRFVGENGPASFEDLFGDKDTLAIYSYMFGPERDRPCPMCTSLLSAWDGEARDIEQTNVFTRRDGTLRHFWGGEMTFSSADPGQDPRGAPDLMPIWTVLDMTPDGRPPGWYPKLEY